MNNPELELAKNFVENTHRNLFLTGRAGTGKTTFLRYIKQHSQKRLVVVAPTGVAAINAQGVTIHSFFQLPFGPILPNIPDRNAKNFKFNKRKIDILRSLDLLIIDEISMVRADLLDGIDQILRRFNDKNKPFGGIQLLMIGDVQQLAPVVKQDEWNLISKFYETPFFFSSKAYQEARVVTIELQKIYRQEDKKFIDILEEVRNNKLTDSSLKILNERYQPDFKPQPNEGYITLSTHNNTADNINNRELNALKEKSFFYKASIKGTFPEYAYPTLVDLELKDGAQVMFIKNDSDAEKRYFNGKIGKIIEIGKDFITVQCPGDVEPIEVNTEKWENYNYTIHPETQEIEEEVIGSFEQIPLKLAWAITIHKSQGLTFEKAIIDAQLSFAHGQTYVALSRCKTLEGMVLMSKINSNAVINDYRVSVFSDDVRNNMPSSQQLENDVKQFQLELITELFDFKDFLFPINASISHFNKNQHTFRGNFNDEMRPIRDAIQDELLKVSANFQTQLERMSQTLDDVEKDLAVQERLAKGIEFYKKFIAEKIESHRSNAVYSTDNKEVKKDLEKWLDQFDALLHLKKICLNGLENGFKTHKYLELRAKAHLYEKEIPKKRKANYQSENHPLLYEELKSLRQELADIESEHPYQIFTQETLIELCEILPKNKAQLKKISGIGKVRLNKYGEDILDVILEYCDKNNIELSEIQEEDIVEEKPKRPVGETYQITLQMFKKGKNLEEIAKERGLSQGTIEGHLAKFVSEGTLKVTDILTQERYEFLRKEIENRTYESFTDLKTQLGESVSFGEIRLIVSQLEREKK